MKIVKHSGNIVDYNPSKLKQSLLKSGASQMTVSVILNAIEKEIYEGIPSKQIYKMAFNLLKKVSNSHAARYNLKEAVRLLGPAGFFFEKYIARIFTAEKYQTLTNVVLQGNCVSHEIDVLIKKGDEIAMVECKFHMGKEAHSDVKIPMYILSRFNDLKDNRHTAFTRNDVISKCWIVSNNRFTSDAIAFGKCSKLNLLCWDFPENNNLKTKNDRNHLYPVTCLTTLSLAEKDKLLMLDVILVKEILKNSECLEKIGLSSNRIKNVIKESYQLCEYI
ncbi:ATP cone domain-containing protein [Flavobacterium fluvii]|uniref:ATP cone domain-containing protein n=1 Tax=Flavobacterium fluvii TaxID=468056 RepID=A0A1M5G8C6_9FLAO|nr:restriction endonuclease [Flavobacterium fluvii]SHF99995.1 ATP cone domain-containing protein [Flavobacterium fluvii]